ncbi:hypothetical protein Z043_104789, partial [Scleropages formosus]
DLSENQIQGIPRKAFRGAVDIKNLRFVSRCSVGLAWETSFAFALMIYVVFERMTCAAYVSPDLRWLSRLPYGTIG